MLPLHKEMKVKSWSSTSVLVTCPFTVCLMKTCTIPATLWEVRKYIYIERSSPMCCTFITAEMILNLKIRNNFSTFTSFEMQSYKEPDFLVPVGFFFQICQSLCFFYNNNLKFSFAKHFFKPRGW